MKTVSRKIERIQLSKGLEDLDDNYDLLARLYERLQLAAVETSDLETDLLTFANKASDFAVIIKAVHTKVSRINGQKEEREISSSLTSKSVIGFVYLTASTNKNGPSANSQLNMGIIVGNEHQRRGYGKRAIKLALNRAFKLFRCHRIQATVIDPLGPTMHAAYKAFIAAGFKQEGIWRRAHYNPFDSVWQDVAYLAMLDTEWVLRQGKSKGNEPPITTWDEMLSRHQREGEDLGSVWTGSKRKAGMAEEIREIMVDWQTGFNGLGAPESDTE